MKLVKFKDGTYGVRRWRYLWLQYEFASMLSPTWFSTPEYVLQHCHGTREQAEKRMNELQPNLDDIGEPV